MLLIYEHWKFGRVERDVSRVPGTVDTYQDLARVYRVSPITHEVYNAGDVICGVARHRTPVKVGWGAELRRSETRGRKSA